jgi:carbonic anhydrase
VKAFIRLTLQALLSVVIVLHAWVAMAQPQPAQPVPVMSHDASTILEALLQGNQRFVSGHSQHPHQEVVLLQHLASGQHPKVAVLACSDSRVAPELLFDQGFGDVFDVRVAGNIVDSGVLGSLEYAVEHLHVSLIIVLGHSHCGAIAAALAHQHPHNHMAHVLHQVAWSVQNGPHNADEVAKLNAQHAVTQLAHAPVIKHALQQGELTLLPAFVDLDSGNIIVLPSPLTKAPHRLSHR